MKNFAKAAIVAFGVTGALAAAPASAQSYDPNYDQGEGYYEDEGAYPEDAYAQGYGAYDDQAAYDDQYGAGYCDEYGCPEDYYDLPVYYGDVYYGGSWLTGPLYYRDWSGSRQFWVHGGWRSAQHRGGRFGSALGRRWYQQNRGFRNGFTNRNAYRGYNGGYRQRSYGDRNFGQQRNFGQNYRQRSFGGGSNFTPNTRQSFRGNNDWRSNWSNRQGFGQNSFGQNSFRPRDSGQSNFGQRNFRQRDPGQNNFRQRDFSRSQNFSQQRQSFGGDRGAWRQNQAARSSGDGGRRSWGGRGDGGGRGGDRGRNR